jgi:hypothetical protein
LFVAGAAVIGAEPVPLSVTSTVPPGAPVTRNVALLPPLAVGLKETATVQPAAGASVAPAQVFVPITKSPGLAPISETARVPVVTTPGFEIVKVVAAEACPIVLVP